jgi:hypothetical protein
MKIVRAHPIVVVHETEPNRVDLAPPLRDELLGCFEIVVGTDAHDFEIVAEELRAEVTVEAQGT